MTSFRSNVLVFTFLAGIGGAIAGGSSEVAWQASGLGGTIRDIAVEDQTVVTVGSAPVVFASVWAVRAYDRRTGTLVWEDQQIDRLFSSAVSVAIAGGRAFVAGTSPSATPGLRVLTVIAYDLRRGTIEWERMITPVTTSVGNVVRVRAGRVFVGGFNVGADGWRYGVYALHAGTGEVEWTHESEGAGPGTAGVVWSMAVTASEVLVAGDAGGSSHSNSSVFVRSLDRGTGALLWQNVIPLATTSALPGCLNVGRNLVFVCGSHHVPDLISNDLMVRAYDLRTGELRWADRPDDGGLWSSAQALTVSGDRLAVGGTICDFSQPTTVCKGAVRTYDADTGALVWQDLDSGSFVQDVAAESELVFVAGSGTDASGSASATIRAYDVETGVVAWIDHVPAGADGIVSYSRLTVEDNDLFAGGSIFGRFANTTYVRALSLRPALSR
jgi:outer membrane protein assembly factor BamB